MQITLWRTDPCPIGPSLSRQAAFPLLFEQGKQEVWDQPSDGTIDTGTISSAYHDWGAMSPMFPLHASLERQLSLEIVPVFSKQDCVVKEETVVSSVFVQSQRRVHNQLKPKYQLTLVPVQALFPTSPVESLQLWLDRHASFPISPLLFTQASNPLHYERERGRE